MIKPPYAALEKNRFTGKFRCMRLLPDLRCLPTRYSRVRFKNDNSFLPAIFSSTAAEIITADPA